MAALLVESPGLFMSRRLLEECRTFVSLSGGKSAHQRGAHDDCLMAMALAQAVRAEMCKAARKGCGPHGCSMLLERGSSWRCLRCRQFGECGEERRAS